MLDKRDFFSIPLIKIRTASLTKLLEAYRHEFLVGIANCESFLSILNDRYKKAAQSMKCYPCCFVTHGDFPLSSKCT